MPVTPHALADTLDLIVTRGRQFVTGDLPYTIANRREVVSTVIADLGLDSDQSHALQARAIPRIAFAPSDKFALRLIQSLSEVLR